MFVFRKEILAMISNELNKRLVNYGLAIARVEELEKSNRHLRIRLHTMEQNLQRICKDVDGVTVLSVKELQCGQQALWERLSKLEKSIGTQAAPVQGGLPVTSDQRIAELREELAKHKHAAKCTRIKLNLLGVRGV